MDITELKVHSFDLDHLDISWKISPLVARPGDQPHEIFDYDFRVLRAEALAGPYELIGGPFRDTYFFRDNKVSLLHNWRNYAYKVLVTHRPTNESQEFGPVMWRMPPPDRIACEIIRQEDLRFRELVGRRCWLYTLRTFGPICTCHDPYTKRKEGRHLPCFGTGWLGGYYAPVEVWVQIDPAPKGTQSTYARMIAYPPVSPGDVLVEFENRRWKVGPGPVTLKERLRAPVLQEFPLSEIAAGDIEYELPIKIDAQNTEPSAIRNFTNPQSTERDEDYSDILAAYRFRGGPPR